MKPLTICKDMTNKLLIDWLQKKRKVSDAGDVFVIRIKVCYQNLKQKLIIQTRTMKRYHIFLMEKVLVTSTLVHVKCN